MEQAFQLGNTQGWRSHTYCSDLSLSYAYISVFGLKIGSTTKQWTVVKSCNSVVLNLFNLWIVRMMIQKTYQEKITQKILKPGKKLNHVTANFKMKMLNGPGPRRVQRETAHKVKLKWMRQQKP